MIKKSGKNIAFIEEIILQNIFLEVQHDQNRLNFIKEVVNYNNFYINIKNNKFETSKQKKLQKQLFKYDGIVSFFQLEDRHWRLFVSIINLKKKLLIL